jgi:hypothetical protein
MLRKLVCGSRLLHPIHGRGAFQRSNIISNLAVPLGLIGGPGGASPWPSESRRRHSFKSARRAWLKILSQQFQAFFI